MLENMHKYGIYMDKLFQNRNGEAVHGRIRGMVETQNPSNRNETMEKPESHL